MCIVQSNTGDTEVDIQEAKGVHLRAHIPNTKCNLAASK